MDRALRTHLESRFADKVTGPVRQRHDTTELRIGAADLTEVMTALHDESGLAFVILAVLAMWGWRRSVLAATFAGAAGYGLAVHFIG